MIFSCLSPSEHQGASLPSALSSPPPSLHTCDYFSKIPKYITSGLTGTAKLPCIQVMLSPTTVNPCSFSLHCDQHWVLYFCLLLLVPHGCFYLLLIIFLCIY